jgi:inner membrane protein
LALQSGRWLTGILVGIGLAPAGVMGLILVFAVLSVLAWLVLRRVMGLREGQVKIWDRDINDSK